MSLSPLDRILLQKAAEDEGFGLARADDGEWMAYDGLGTPISLRLLRRERIYYVAVDHPGVAAELATRWQVLPPRTEPIPPPGFTHFGVADSAPLHQLIGEVYQLARALPSAPLRQFVEQTGDLPRGTEAERVVIQRKGQDIFREALLRYWGGRCAVTGVSETRLLRASHVKPWALCATDAERLDVYNGLLLAAHLDAAFDCGLIGFSDGGRILISSALSAYDCVALGVHAGLSLVRIAPAHVPNLAWHRTHFSISTAGEANA